MIGMKLELILNLNRGDNMKMTLLMIIMTLIPYPAIHNEKIMINNLIRIQKKLQMIKFLLNQFPLIIDLFIITFYDYI
jgi:hypothetical protein